MSGNYGGFFDGAKAVGLDLRSPPPDLGHQIVTVDSIRFHNGISGPGVITEVLQADGTTRGFRIQLGGKFPQYGKRDTKILIAAVMGYSLDDPRAASVGEEEIARYLDASNPAHGVRIAIDTTEGSKIDPKTGKPYRQVRPIALGSEAPPSSAGAAPTPPAAPAAPKGPPSGWFDFPVGDARRGVSYYNDKGETMAVGA